MRSVTSRRVGSAMGTCECVDAPRVLARRHSTGSTRVLIVCTYHDVGSLRTEKHGKHRGSQRMFARLGRRHETGPNVDVVLDVGKIRSVLHDTSLTARAYTCRVRPKIRERPVNSSLHAGTLGGLWLRRRLSHRGESPGAGNTACGDVDTCRGCR